MNLYGELTRFHLLSSLRQTWCFTHGNIWCPMMPMTSWLCRHLALHGASLLHSRDWVELVVGWHFMRGEWPTFSGHASFWWRWLQGWKTMHIGGSFVTSFCGLDTRSALQGTSILLKSRPNIVTGWSSLQRWTQLSCFHTCLWLGLRCNDRLLKLSWTSWTLKNHGSLSVDWMRIWWEFTLTRCCFRKILIKEDAIWNAPGKMLSSTVSSTRMVFLVASWAITLMDICFLIPLCSMLDCLELSWRCRQVWDSWVYLRSWSHKQPWCHVGYPMTIVPASEF